MFDATEAFVRVYCNLLLVKKMPHIIISVILQMYSISHKYSLEWYSLSKRFRVVNGVHQSAILSPILFCVYFYVLLNNLDSSEIGCHIGSFFVGALAYAGILVLLAPSANAMRSMLHTCDVYATQYNVLFNANNNKPSEYTVDFTTLMRTEGVVITPPRLLL